MAPAIGGTATLGDEPHGSERGCRPRRLFEQRLPGVEIAAADGEHDDGGGVGDAHDGGKAIYVELYIGR